MFFVFGQVVLTATTKGSPAAEHRRFNIPPGRNNDLDPPRQLRVPYWHGRAGHRVSDDATFMIIDCYTHTWELDEQLGRCIPARSSSSAAPHAGSSSRITGAARHLAAAEPVDTTIVLGFTSHALAAEIPNDQVAAYVAQHPDRLIGFAGIDPSAPKEAIAEMHRARDQLSMLGIAVAPAAQDFHPSNSQAMLVYAAAAERRLPVVFHTGVYMASASKLEYGRPVLLDEVARELPDLRMVIAHMGHPWEHETITLLSKHTNVFAEISWLLREPWRAYQALLSAHQCGVIDKLLFGSGFPAAAASYCIEALYSINHLVHGTNLPPIPREQLRGIVERDALSLLGIADHRPNARHQPASAIIEDDPDEM